MLLKGLPFEQNCRKCTISFSKRKVVFPPSFHEERDGNTAHNSLPDGVDNNDEDSVTHVRMKKILLGARKATSTKASKIKSSNKASATTVHRSTL